ncbi:MAG: hypothetical protein KAH01_02460, partial [Caldisericia bacterium]|nr:hypothetical protein [Caldisericia bacterium]
KYAGVAVANVTGVNKAIEAFFTEELSKNMRKYIDAALDPAMDIYKKRVSESFLRLQKVYEEDQRDGSKKDKVPLSIIPAMAWMTMTKAERTYPADINSPEFAAHHSKLLKKYGMPLTSRKQVVVKMKDGTNVIITKEVPNSLTAIVNAIHGIDSAIFFKSHMDTLAEIDTIIKSGKFRGETLSEAEIEGFTTAKQNASGMVHDENNADPYYNAVYVPHYQKNSVEISGEYDVEEQLALTYLSYKDSNGAHDAESAATMHKEAMKLKDRKLSALKSIPRDSHKFFGFKEGMPESNLGSKTKKDTETETKKEGKKPVHEDMSTPFDPEPEPEATPEPEVEEHEPIFEPPKEETKPEISKEQKEFDRLEQIKNSRINDLDDAKAEHAEAKRKSDAYDDKVADYEIAMEDYIADGSKGQKPYKPRNTGFGTKVAVADQKVNAAQ